MVDPISSLVFCVVVFRCFVLSYELQYDITSSQAPSNILSFFFFNKLNYHTRASWSPSVFPLVSASCIMLQSSTLGAAWWSSTFVSLREGGGESQV
ncbi:hypothetical protein B0F90DRAFT_1363261 [Multifurca ochricompacta]|uniref:Uncharacterized protein n=1 Tax=Multifurca ochricompacta TaxID=376703 RepID=A0AAD4M631_9AGAM|nr:hypothetical protein B0F90DRAFT_1363261 [Multifurca ochricompacta]